MCVVRASALVMIILAASAEAASAAPTPALLPPRANANVSNVCHRLRSTFACANRSELTCSWCNHSNPFILPRPPTQIGTPSRHTDGYRPIYKCVSAIPGSPRPSDPCRLITKFLPLESITKLGASRPPPPPPPPAGPGDPAQQPHIDLPPAPPTYGLNMAIGRFSDSTPGT